MLADEGEVCCRQGVDEMFVDVGEVDRCRVLVTARAAVFGKLSDKVTQVDVRVDRCQRNVSVTTHGGDVPVEITQFAHHTAMDFRVIRIEHDEDCFFVRRLEDGRTLERVENVRVLPRTQLSLIVLEQFIGQTVTRQLGNCPGCARRLVMSEPERIGEKTDDEDRLHDSESLDEQTSGSGSGLDEPILVILPDVRFDVVVDGVNLDPASVETDAICLSVHDDDFVGTPVGDERVTRAPCRSPVTSLPPENARADGWKSSLPRIQRDLAVHRDGRQREGFQPLLAQVHDERLRTCYRVTIDRL